MDEVRKREFSAYRTRAIITEHVLGRPIPRIQPGRQTKPTGRIVCVKAGFTAMPWESIRAERPMLHLCEVASPVLALLAQPHVIEFNVRGQVDPKTYTPDLRLEVDRRFADDVGRGMPFAMAVEFWKPKTGEPADTVTMIIEVKDDDDRRLGEPDYDAKLRMAQEIYEGQNWRFATVARSKDIERREIAVAVREIMLDHDGDVAPTEAVRVEELLERQGLAFLSEVEAVLGGGVVGRKKAAALHVRRVIAIDLGEQLNAKTIVRLVRDGRAIF
jgi:hypothetical protein